MCSACQIKGDFCQHGICFRGTVSLDIEFRTRLYEIKSVFNVLSPVVFKFLKFFTS